MDLPHSFYSVLKSHVKFSGRQQICNKIYGTLMTLLSKHISQLGHRSWKEKKQTATAKTVEYYLYKIIQTEQHAHE